MPEAPFRVKAWCVSGPAQPDSSAQVVDQVVLLIGHLLRSHNIEVVKDMAPDFPALMVNAVHFRQVILNLLVNAQQAMKEGGTVCVRGRREGTGVVIEVQDQGPGIRDEDLPRIFERFWRADNAPAGGTGLGLSIAAWIVEAHGGAISAANRPEGGARFEVRLPTSA